MIDYERHLNPEQLEVVTSGAGPILVIAGAGSGKTRALTYRVARLIELGEDPGRILLATFTNKAARSMLSRVESLVEFDLGNIWGGTFHHVGNRILRRHARLLGYESNYTIIDGVDSKQLVNATVTELGITKSDRFPRGNILGDIISLSTNTRTTIEEVVLQKYPYYFNYITDILKVALRYRIRKKELNVMDFDDLLCKWEELLVNFPDVLEKYSERFLHILVDEYQDTNIIQAKILDLLAANHRNLMVVGDDSQSIYSFRGADFTNIIRFPEKYPDAHIFKLETNYRSTREILHLANMSIVNNVKQFQKELRAVRGGGIRPVFVPIRDVIQQADFVAQRINELIDEGIIFPEIAVLYRAHFHSMELQMELVRRGIPFEIRSGIRFFEQAHIKDVTAFMRLIINPLDELAWKRILTLYHKIGRVTAEKIWLFISTRPDPLATIFSEDFINCAGRAAIPGLTQFRKTLKNIIDLDDTPAIINTVLESGYREYLKGKYQDTTSREEDLNQLANFSSKFDSLPDLLNDLALLTNITEETETGGLNNGEEKVVLTTIHQAKGLEWSVVFMICCSEGKIPLARALKEPGGEDEERRLFYVATTRAKDQLYFCHTAIDFMKGMRKRVLNPSRFIKELAPSTAEPGEFPFDQWVVDEY